MQTTLVVLAAGMGARYGAGIKQLEPVGPNGELIIDYSIHDAVEAGFDRVVFILRKDILDDFRAVIGDRLERVFGALGIRWDYVFQSMDDLPAGRTKPWGTGQAILACRDVLDGPFAVINADDYYGKGAYRMAHDFLTAGEKTPDRYGLIGFVLKNTLSEAGGVNRGVCQVDEAGFLTGIEETRHIIKTADGAAVMQDDGMLRPLDRSSLVSMNFLMLTPSFAEGLQARFDAFRANTPDPLKDEFLLPIILGDMIREGRATVRVLPTDESWFGVTYHEDAPAVRAAIVRLIDRGVYREDLFSDLQGD